MKAPKALHAMQAPWKAIGVPEGPMNTIQDIGWTALPFAAPFVGGAMGTAMSKGPRIASMLDQEDEDNSPWSQLRLFDV